MRRINRWCRYGSVLSMLASGALARGEEPPLPLPLPPAAPSELPAVIDEAPADPKPAPAPTYSAPPEVTIPAPAEPTAADVLGRSVSPYSKRTRSGGTPSVSAASCAMTVAVPIPISCDPDEMTTVPSAFIRARAEAGERCAGYVALAMPQPMRLRPLLIDFGFGFRFDHPNFSAARV